MVDPDPEVRTLAVQQRIVERITADTEGIIHQADIIILATPVGTILENIHLLGEQASTASRSGPPLEPGRIILLDLGSTKQAVVEAMQSLPQAFDPIGGHPICGKETSGLKHAEASLFVGATFAFTALERTSMRAHSFANSLAAAVSASPVWIDAASHDRWVAFTSHLPYLLANALAGIIPDGAASFIGPGYRSTSRLASPRSLCWTFYSPTVKGCWKPYTATSSRLEDRKALAEGDFTRLTSCWKQGAHDTGRV
jgi:prephenate dehydrogenase